MARRYGKEIAVVEPVKGGALMNLPEEAAVLLYQASDCIRCGLREKIARRGFRP